MKERAALNASFRSRTSLSVEPNIRHKILLGASWLVSSSLIVILMVHGYSYYRLPLSARVFSPLHSALKPSGSIGIRLGILGLILFGFLFLYPLRKRWPWFGKIGKTKHWLDFHVLFGITAPIIITFHSSFKLQGIAGVAYWIMMAVMLSGIVGRYLYALIPRSISSLEMSLKEIEDVVALQSRQLGHQALVSSQELEPLFKVPSATKAREMSLVQILFTLVWLDFMRPFRVARLRRRSISSLGKWATVGGILTSGNEVLETIVSTAKRQSWMITRMLFLDRIHEVFHLWHVVHRPFSYSFVVLVAVHIGVVLLLGYY